MEPAGDALAPDLVLDDKAQYGFVQWFQNLPKASSSSTVPTCPLLQSQPALGLRTPAGVQDTSIVRFFDRKVGSVIC